MEVTTDSPAQTRALGEAIGACFVEDLLIALVGPLGAGKTQLVKGMALGNDLENPAQVTSPTFTLMHEYAGRIPLYHLDTYRLDHERELVALGFEELLDAGNVVVVEWADRMIDLMPEDALWITIEATGPTSRRFSFRASGPVAARCLTSLPR